MKQFRVGKMVQVKDTRPAFKGKQGKIVDRIRERKMVNIKIPGIGYLISIHEDDLEVL